MLIKRVLGLDSSRDCTYFLIKIREPFHKAMLEGDTVHCWVFVLYFILNTCLIISDHQPDQVQYRCIPDFQIHLSSSELDFDLTDPYAILMGNSYKPLHDPHLKPHLTAAQMRRRLYRGGFITKNGKVLCTLKEYNVYRQYLRKINLALNRRREVNFKTIFCIDPHGIYG